jgi:glycosyltransferase involved in cell wall biosynthesis
VVTTLEREAVAGWGVDRGKLLLDPMGFERDDATGGEGRKFRERWGIPPGRVVVGHLATLDPNKGTNDLVSAVASLNENRPEDDPIGLVLAGISSPHFEEFASTLPESSKRWLVRTGPLAPEVKADFFDTIDLFSMPSRTDSFGIVFLEAWANGKAVVAARAGGVVEVVDQDRNGLLVEFGDVPALAGAIGRLADDPAARRKLGEAGRSKVERGYTWDDCFARLEERLSVLRAGGRPERLGLGPVGPNLSTGHRSIPS